MKLDETERKIETEEKKEISNVIHSRIKRV